MENNRLDTGIILTFGAFILGYLSFEIGGYTKISFIGMFGILISIVIGTIGTIMAFTKNRDKIR